MTIPPLVIDSMIAAHHKQVNAVGSPGDRCDIGDGIASEILKRGKTGIPAMTIPPLVIDRVVASYHKVVDTIGCP
jgi:hypothetical protein